MIATLILLLFIFLTPTIASYLTLWGTIGFYSKYWNEFLESKIQPQVTDELYKEYGQWRFDGGRFIWFEFDGDIKLPPDMAYVTNQKLFKYTCPHVWYWQRKYEKVAKQKKLELLNNLTTAAEVNERLKQN